MIKLTRRNFLAGSAAAAAAMFVPHSRALGANEDIRVAVIGLRWRGGELVDEFRKVKGCRVVALCDVDSTILDRDEQRLAKSNCRVARFTDLRKVLDDKSIDAVALAVPNHWHALATVWACQAGKDVYVEKPVSHTIWEGRKMVEAAQKYNRIVQGGTQSRSGNGLIEAVDYIRSGKLGKIQYVRGLCYKRRESMGKVPGPQPIPSTIDYDLWCGPAPKAPLMRTSFHYDWHWQWPTGNGELGDMCAHYLDVARWFLGHDQAAPRVLSIGGRLGYIDDGQTPNTHIAWFDYQPAPIIVEIRGLAHDEKSKQMDVYRGSRLGTIVQCEHGYFSGAFSGGWAYDNDGKKLKQFVLSGVAVHQANFIKAVQSRKNSDLNAQILEGHLSHTLCHMGNISHRLGAATLPAQIRDAVKNNPVIAETLERMMPHLEANKVDLAQTPLMLGAALEFDPKAERFIGNRADEANAYLTRPYRTPFVLPEQV